MCWQTDPDIGDVVMSRFATMITREFTECPTSTAQLRQIHRRMHAHDIQGMNLTLYRMSLWVKSPRPYLMLIGFALFLGFWYLAVEVWKLPRFREMPGITAVVKEWLSRDPTYGLSLYTEEYYEHIWVSIWRVTQAFVLATVLGVPFGLFLGWSKKFKEYVFPVFETLRPIPILAWVPLAIVMFVATESAVIYLTFLASFFATALNTMLGVESIDESYVRAANCLGASRSQVFRHVILPGALPFIFTGLQISIGVSWFSLVAAEMVSGQYGLGYVINTSYTMVRYPTIVIGMITLGAVGYVTSAHGPPGGRLSDAVAHARARPRRPMMADGDHGSAGRLGFVPASTGARSDRHRRRREDLRSRRRRGDGRRSLLAQHRGGRDLHDRRSVRLRQDDAAQRHRRISRDHVRPHPARRRSAVQHGEAESRALVGPYRRIPERRALPVEDQSGERRLRPADAGQAQQGRTRPKRRGR